MPTANKDRQIARFVAAPLALVLAALVLSGGSLASGQGTSTCRASAARATLSGSVLAEPVVANSPGTPCEAQSDFVTGTETVGGLTVSSPSASTTAGPNSISASASVDSASIAAIGPLPLVKVGHVSATETVTCSSGQDSSSGSSSVDGLVVGTTPVSIVGSQPVDEMVAGVGIRANQVSGGTRQALVIELGTTEYVLGEATASGEACSSGTGTGPGTQGTGGSSGNGSGSSGGSPSSGGTSGPSTGTNSNVDAPTTVSAAELECSSSRLVLYRVVQQGSHAFVQGAAAPALKGHEVTIILVSTGQRAARARVRPDGLFQADATLPPRALRYTNAARYEAASGSARSAALKLHRRLSLSSGAVAGRRIRLTGDVTTPLDRPPALITISLRLSCTRSVVVARVRPSRTGRFAVRVPVPAAGATATYLARTSVRANSSSRATFPTYSLPEVLSLRGS
jgi:hypothetical protein